jgi:hypothetical protein
VFSFDGSVLSIRVDKKVIALPGEGSPWAVRFKVEARTLRRLPKRFTREHIGVSIWESRLTLGNYLYAGTLEEFGPGPSRIQ